MQILRIPQDKAEEIRSAFHEWKAQLSPLEWQDVLELQEREASEKLIEADSVAMAVFVHFTIADARFAEFLTTTLKISFDVAE